jgi:hypothetical protein
MTLEDLMEAALSAEEHFSPEELEIAAKTEYENWAIRTGRANIPEHPDSSDDSVPSSSFMKDRNERA